MGRNRTKNVKPRNVHYREIPGCHDYYVGDDGTIWSGRDRYGRPKEVWTQLATYRRPYGSNHVVVCLRPNGGYKDKTVLFYVHRLVLEAFIGPCPDGMEACHNDGNGSNNNLSNLRWDTRIANAQDMVSHGTARLGEKCHFAKLTVEEVIEIRRFCDAKFPHQSVADMFEVARSTVSRISRRVDWKWLP